MSACIPYYNSPPPRLAEPITHGEYSPTSRTFNQLKSAIDSDNAKEQFKEQTLNFLRNNLSKSAYYGTLLAGGTGYSTFKYFNSHIGGSFNVDNFKFSGEVGKDDPGKLKMDFGYTDFLKENDRIDFSIGGDTGQNFEVKMRWSMPLEKLF